MGLIFKNIFLAIPFYFLWNWLAPTYFTALPVSHQELPFWHCVGLLMLIAVIRNAIGPSSPSIFTKIKWKGRNRFKDYIDVN